MLRIALRNLFQNKIRLVLAVGGVALALMLILALDAVVGGIVAKISSNPLTDIECSVPI